MALRLSLPDFSCTTLSFHLVPVYALSPALVPVTCPQFFFRPLDIFSLPRDPFTPFLLASTHLFHLGLYTTSLQGCPWIPWARSGHTTAFHSSCTFLSEHSLPVHVHCDRGLKAHILFFLFPALSQP